MVTPYTKFGPPPGYPPNPFAYNDPDFGSMLPVCFNLPGYSAPGVSFTPGGNLPRRTYYVAATYQNSSSESFAIPECQITIPANNLLTVTSPPAQTGWPAWNLYVGLWSSLEARQNTSTMLVGTNWTEPTYGISTTGAFPGPGFLPSVNSILVGLCSYGAITNPTWDTRPLSSLWPAGYQSGMAGGTVDNTGRANYGAVGGGYFSGLDWGSGTAWLINVPIHWTGTCWTGFVSLLVDTKGLYWTPGPGAIPGAVISGNASAGGIAGPASCIPGPPVTPYPDNHLFADIPDVLHLGVGVVLKRDSKGSFSCGVTLTEFEQYNKSAKKATSGIVYPSGKYLGNFGAASGIPNQPPLIVGASKSPAMPLRTLVDCSVGIASTTGSTLFRNPLVVELANVAGYTSQFNINPGSYFFATTSGGTIAALASPATVDDYNWRLGQDSCPITPSQATVPWAGSGLPTFFTGIAACDNTGTPLAGDMKITGATGGNAGAFNYPIYVYVASQYAGGVWVVNAERTESQWNSWLDTIRSQGWGGAFTNVTIAIGSYSGNTGTLAVNYPAYPATTSGMLATLPNFVQGWGMYQNASGNTMRQLVNANVYCEIPMSRGYSLYCFALGGSSTFKLPQ